MWGAVAVAGVGAVAGAHQARQGRRAATAAAEKRASAIEEQTEEMRLAREQQQQMYDEAMDLQRPYIEAGERALSQVEGIATGETDLSQLSSYRSHMREGQRAIETSAVARGMGQSGPTLAELPKASLQARQAVLSELGAVTQAGQQAAGAGANITGQAAGQYGQMSQAIGQSQVQRADARAAGIMGRHRANQQGVQTGLAGLGLASQFYANR